VLITDHRLFREGLRSLLEQQQDRFHVAGEAANASDAVEMLRAIRSGIVLIDLSVRNEGTRADTVQRVKGECPAAHVIVIAPTDSPAEMVRVIRAGANGYLTRTSGIDDVVRAIQVIEAGGSWIDPLLTPLVMAEYRKLNWPSTSPDEKESDLSGRDREFLKLLAAGQNNRQISESTGLAESTVKNNLSSLFRKLGVRDRTQAVLFAIEHGIVPSSNHRHP
jgi:DNA-binding NarL/FixJ family response regulator